MKNIKTFEEVNLFKKIFGLKDTLEPSGLAKPKRINQERDSEKEEILAAIKALKNKDFLKKQEEIEDFLKKQEEIERKRQEEAEERRNEERRRKHEEIRKQHEERQRKLAEANRKFDSEMDYVEDCLYEIGELSIKSQKRKVENGFWKFIYEIPGAKYNHSEWILNDTNLNILKSLKPAITRIKSRIPTATVTLYLHTEANNEGRIVINVYNQIENSFDREDIEEDWEEDDEDWEEDDEDWWEEDDEDDEDDEY